MTLNKAGKYLYACLGERGARVQYPYRDALVALRSVRALLCFGQKQRLSSENFSSWAKVTQLGLLPEATQGALEHLQPEPEQRAGRLRHVGAAASVV